MLAIADVEVCGLEQIPATGPVVLAANHRSLLDGPLLFGFVDRPVNCLVKAEAFRGPIGPILRAAGQIPVRRGAVDPAPVRLGVRILRAGGVLGVFPEGSRGDGRARSARPGVGYFALRSGASVMPVACLGTETLVRLRGPSRRAVQLIVGAPIPIERVPDRQPLNRGLVSQTTEQIRVALAALVDARGRR
jgi:1-acyl-sn-glycerol-3-phosphate acyltransferase